MKNILPSFVFYPLYISSSSKVWDAVANCIRAENPFLSTRVKQFSKDFIS